MILEKKNNFWLFAAVLLVCFTVSVGVRYQQFETWGKTPNVFFVGERPMMTTLDAPYWLRWARKYIEGTYGEDTLRKYPSGSKSFRARKLSPPEYLDPKQSHSNSGIRNIKYSEVPLLSFLIAHIAPFFNYNYYLTGTMMIPVLASLFILPLGILSLIHI